MVSSPTYDIAHAVALVTAHETALIDLLASYGLTATRLRLEDALPGSYWGDSEAGLVGDTIYYRPDTPVHSLLHEACHFICMDAHRRAGLDRDAGGDYAEENAVCYLQILLADRVTDFGRERMFRDMDAWGYTFRLGSARAWFESDAEDARAWLIEHGIIDHTEQITGRRREDERPCMQQP